MCHLIEIITELEVRIKHPERNNMAVKSREGNPFYFKSHLFARSSVLCNKVNIRGRSRTFIDVVTDGRHAFLRNDGICVPPNEIVRHFVVSVFLAFLGRSEMIFSAESSFFCCQGAGQLRSHVQVENCTRAYESVQMIDRCKLG